MFSRALEPFWFRKSQALFWNKLVSYFYTARNYSVRSNFLYSRKIHFFDYTSCFPYWRRFYISSSIFNIASLSGKLVLELTKPELEISFELYDFLVACISGITTFSLARVHSRLCRTEILNPLRGVLGLDASSFPPVVIEELKLHQLDRQSNYFSRKNWPSNFFGLPHFKLNVDSGSLPPIFSEIISFRVVESCLFPNAAWECTSNFIFCSLIFGNFRYTNLLWAYAIAFLNLSKCAWELIWKSLSVTWTNRKFRIGIRAFCLVAIRMEQNAAYEELASSSCSSLTKKFWSIVCGTVLA